MKSNKLLYFCALLLAVPAYAIPDQEPDVTRQVAEVLEQAAEGQAPPERFTERGATYLAAPGAAGLLRRCPRPLALELLSRQVYGEDRLYVYRAACRPLPLRIAIDFNKAARINRLEIAEDR